MLIIEYLFKCNIKCVSVSHDGYERHAFKMCSSNDINQYGAVTLSECLTHCNNTENCVSFLHENTTNLCWLKDVCEIPSLVEDSNIDAFIIIGMCRNLVTLSMFSVLLDCL